MWIDVRAHAPATQIGRVLYHPESEEKAELLRELLGKYNSDQKTSYAMVIQPNICCTCADMCVGCFRSAPAYCIPGAIRGCLALAESCGWFAEDCATACMGYSALGAGVCLICGISAAIAWCVQDIEVSTSNSNGLLVGEFSPITVALLQNNRSAVQALLELGCTVEVKDDFIFWYNRPEMKIDPEKLDLIVVDRLACCYEEKRRGDLSSEIEICGTLTPLHAALLAADDEIVKVIAKYVIQDQKCQIPCQLLRRLRNDTWCKSFCDNWCDCCINTGSVSLTAVELAEHLGRGHLLDPDANVVENVVPAYRNQLMM